MEFPVLLMVNSVCFIQVVPARVPWPCQPRVGRSISIGDRLSSHVSRVYPEWVVVERDADKTLLYRTMILLVVTTHYQRTDH
jgi:hypothetical protein